MPFLVVQRDGPVGWRGRPVGVREVLRRVIMNKIPLIGIVIVITAIVIAAVILRHPAFTTLGPVGALLGVWIYLAWMVLKSWKD